MEKVKCPNPKCGRRIFDIEEMPPGKVVLEMKCSDEEVLKKLYGHFKDASFTDIYSISIPPSFIQY